MGRGIHSLICTDTDIPLLLPSICPRPPHDDTPANHHYSRSRCPLVIAAVSKPTNISNTAVSFLALTQPPTILIQPWSIRGCWACNYPSPVRLGCKGLFKTRLLEILIFEIVNLSDPPIPSTAQTTVYSHLLATCVGRHYCPWRYSSVGVASRGQPGP